MARKSKAYYEGLISKNQPEIIENFAKEGSDFSLIALNTLLEIEMSNKNREGIVTKLREFIGIKQEQETIKETKIATKGGARNMSKQQYIIWRGSTHGITLPREQCGGVTLVKNAPIPVTQEIIDWLTQNHPETDFEVTDKSEDDMANEKKKKEKKE